jgi:hypothetical protein
LYYNNLLTSSRSRVQPADPGPVTLRFAFPDDAAAVARLAALDSAPPPVGPVLVAEIEGELRAALSLEDGGVIADPFHRTLALVALLRARAAQLTSAPLEGRRRHGRMRLSARAQRA